MRISRRGNITYAANPFMQEAISSCKPRLKRISNGGNRLMVVAEDTAEIVGPAGFWVGHDVDRTQFVKLYVNGVKAFRDLSGAGTRVFELVYHELLANPRKDKITLSFSRVDQSITPMSEPTYHRGMTELIEKRFLAESVVQGDYWINPDYVFNGDRIAFVNEYRLRRDTPLREPVQPNETTLTQFVQEESGAILPEYLLVLLFGGIAWAVYLLFRAPSECNVTYRPAARQKI